MDLSIERSCSLLRATTRVWLLQPCLPSLTGSGGIDGPREFGASSFHTLVEKHGVLSSTLLVSHNALPFQLMLLHLIVRNGRNLDRKSSRLVFQEVSDLWRATTPDPINISDIFSLREFTAALQHLKPGEAPDPDSICSELIIPAGASLKSWLRDVFSFCLRRLKACSCDPKANEARGAPKELSTDISALCPLKDPREAYLHPRQAIN